MTFLISRGLGLLLSSKAAYRYNVLKLQVQACNIEIEFKEATNGSGYQKEKAYSFQTVKKEKEQRDKY
jgi:hypothetical protein